MAVLCGMHTIQYSAQNARLSLHKLFTSCIRWGLVSHDSLVNGDWLPVTEWCQCYLPCCQSTSDVVENLGRFLIRSIHARGMTWNWFQWQKMETRNSVDFNFFSKFSAICVHCRVMAAWSCMMLKFLKEIFSVFLEQQPFMVKFLKFCSESFSSRHVVMCCVRILWNLADGKSVKSCIAYLTWKNFA